MKYNTFTFTIIYKIHILGFDLGASQREEWASGHMSSLDGEGDIGKYVSPILDRVLPRPADLVYLRSGHDKNCSGGNITSKAEKSKYINKCVV